MGYITNEKRQKKVSKLTKNYLTKKVIIATTIILTALLLVALIISIFMPGTLPIFAENEAGKNVLTAWGVAGGVLSAIVIILDLISLILVFTFRSPGKVFVDTVDVLSKPLSGKSQKKGNDVRSRAVA